mmetsp:Transcript_1594/g.3411  ORF Transcript_1594/g.3411 Transcript_1594/m.3411 type:complete len:456 (-) Transcript_1594:100-1467(-)
MGLRHSEGKGFHPAAVVELENRLHEMLDVNGGLQETRWTGHLVDLMRETENSEGKLYLMKVLLQTEFPAPLSRFVQLGGVEVLVRWLNVHSRNSSQLDCLVLHTALNGLNKLNLNSDVVTRTDLAALAGALSKFPDPGVAYAAAALLARLKNPPEEPRIIVKRPPPPPQPEVRAPVYQGPKILRWKAQDQLEHNKYFYLDDPPTVSCATSRPATQREERLVGFLSASDYRSAEVKREKEINVKLKEDRRKVELELASMTTRLPYELVIISKPKRHKEQLLSLEAEEIAKAVATEAPSTSLEPQETSSYSTVTADIPLITIYTPSAISDQPNPATARMQDHLGSASFMPGMVFPFQNPLFFQPRVPINTRTNKPMNYRTVPCRNFHSPAGCERGDNCHFIHDFGFEGKPISNINDWKKSNEIRQKNLKAMQNLSLGFAAYYPPAGPEPHLLDRKPT